VKIKKACGKRKIFAVMCEKGVRERNGCADKNKAGCDFVRKKHGEKNHIPGSISSKPLVQLDKKEPHESLPIWGFERLLVTEMLIDLLRGIGGNVTEDAPSGTVASRSSCCARCPSQFCRDLVAIRSRRNPIQ